MNDIITIPNAVVEVKEGKIQFKNFDEIKENINKELALYDNLIVDESTKQQVKETKAKLNKIAKALDDERKAREKEYLAPFEYFKGQVKEVTELIKDKSNELDEKIKFVEQKVIDEKASELKLYFDELLIKNEALAFVKFEQIGLKINLSNSVVGLKKEIDSYLKNIGDDLQIINSTSIELKDKLMVKYLTNNYDVKKAQLLLNQELELEKQVKESNVTNIEEVKFIKPIIEKEKVSEIVEFSFTIKTPKHKVKELYNYLKENKILIKGEDY